MSGSYQADSKGYYWYTPDDEIHIEPYQRRRQRADLMDNSDGWLDPDWKPHISVRQPDRELSADDYAAIVSVLSGQTREEWEAKRLVEGMPTSPIGEEKQD